MKKNIYFVSILTPVLFFVMTSSAYALTLGPNNGATFVSDTTGGTRAWTTPGNAATSNDSRATVSLNPLGVVSRNLKATNFGFSIPQGSTINGIQVDVERMQAGGSPLQVSDNSVKIVKSNVIGGTEKASLDLWPVTDGYKSYGGPTDLWGQSWTVNDINSANFGVAVGAKKTSSTSSREARVDHIRITVYYTPTITPPDPNAFTKGMVTMSFDDGYSSIFANISRLGSFKSTQYIYTVTMIGATNCEGSGCYSDYISAPDLRTMKAMGHEIASHTVTHRSLPTLDSLDTLFETDGARLDLLRQIGTPVTSLAYPFGELNDAVIAKLKSAGYSGARTVNFIDAFGQPTFNTKTTDHFRLAAVQINSDTPIRATDPLPAGWQANWGYLESWIDTAIAKKTWLILVFHEIRDDCPNNFCISPDKLSQIVSFLQSKGSNLDVVTVGEGLSKLNNNPVSNPGTPIITQNNVTTKAASQNGAPVTFSPTVTDDDNVPGGLSVFCTAPPAREFIFLDGTASGVRFPRTVASGSIFPIGNTQVTCTAADFGGRVGTKTFTVTVTP